MLIIFQVKCYWKDNLLLSSSKIKDFFQSLLRNPGEYFRIFWHIFFYTICNDSINTRTKLVREINQYTRLMGIKYNILYAVAFTARKYFWFNHVEMLW